MSLDRSKVVSYKSRSCSPFLINLTSYFGSSKFCLFCTIFRGLFKNWLVKHLFILCIFSGHHNKYSGRERSAAAVSLHQCHSVSVWNRSQYSENRWYCKYKFYVRRISVHNWTLLFMDETKWTTFTASLRSWWFCLSSAQMSGQAARRMSVRSFFPSR